MELTWYFQMLWHGGGDINVPVAMMKKASERLRGSEGLVLEKETHMSLPVNHTDKILLRLLGSNP
jgi:hypothetical protein